MTRLILTSTCIALALIALAAAGCGGGGGGGEERPPVGAAPAMPTSPKDPRCGAVPAMISGRWRVNIDPADVPPEIADMRTGPLPMELGPGHRAIFCGGKPHGAEASPVCVVGDRILISPGECDGHPGVGVYRWRVRSDGLVFTRVSDNCPYTSFFMTVHVWNREGSG